MYGHDKRISYCIVKITEDEEPFFWDCIDRKKTWKEHIRDRIRWASEDISRFFRKMYRTIKRFLSRDKFLQTDLSYLNKVIMQFSLPRLRQFRECEDFMAVPGLFCKKDEPFEKSMERWKHLIDEAIFALEYFLHCEHCLDIDGKTKWFWIKYFNEVPWEVKPSNEYFTYHYYYIEKRPGLSRWSSCNEELDADYCAKEKCELRRIHRDYHNWSLEEKARKRAMKGIVIFGRILPCLWGCFDDKWIKEINENEGKETNETNK